MVVVGSGAREHAIVHGLAQSGATVWATPGNAGMAEEAEIFAAATPAEMVQFFGSRRPLVVIGPEAPLAAGWSDALREEGFPVVGPSARGALLESSKRLAKEVMRNYGVPTAEAKTAYNPDQLAAWVGAETRWPKVFKQSGLAQGKGVRILADPVEALATVEQWRELPQIWQDGILYEDFLTGYELSVQVVTNGHEYEWLPVARDYKRLTPDPKSPNTGGMGAVAPILDLDANAVDRINRQVFDPIMTYLTEEKILYRGVLYAGLMMTDDGVQVLEFNVRMGDPETQAVIPSLAVDWWEFWLALSQGQVPKVPPPHRAAVAVVMAAQGYPEKPVSGLPIRLGDALPDTLLYHAATTKRQGGWESDGGRVLTIVGLADSVPEARGRAYARVRRVQFPDSYHRPDIGE